MTVESSTVGVTVNGKKDAAFLRCANMAEWKFEKYDHLQDAVKRFFEILDIEETSDGGRDFHPNRMDFESGKINSCRVHNTAELKSIFDQMKVLSGYRQAKEMKDWNI